MSYSSNPLLPNARAQAVKLVVEQKLPMSVAARKSGIHRSTIWRWKQRWDKLNEYVQLTNDNRPTRQAGLAFRHAACTWLIPTFSSRPHTSPHAVSDKIVARVLELRRHHCFDGARKKRVRPDNPRRPLVTKPGELVQTDTIHYICPLTKRRRYVYTVIDLHTRMAYAEVHSRILPGIAADVVRRARSEFGFAFHLVQADNGPEFGRYFALRLARTGTKVRHTRLGRPNDNAHIERFNRTVQEECLGNKLTYKTTNKQVQVRLTAYLDYYNFERVHLSLQCLTPAAMLRRS